MTRLVGEHLRKLKYTCEVKISKESSCMYELRHIKIESIMATQNPTTPCKHCKEHFRIDNLNQKFYPRGSEKEGIQTQEYAT